MKKLIIAAIALTALSGCSRGDYSVDRNAMNHTKMAFVGIPTMWAIGLGLQGTTTPITKATSLTAKHVAYPTLRHVLKTDAFCDIALIKQNNKGEMLPRLADAKIGDKVTIYGYSYRSGLPVSSSGTALSFKREDGCKLVRTDAGAVQGMSGGGVFNQDGDLIGIVTAIELFGKYTYFVPVQSFRSVL